MSWGSSGGDRVNGVLEVIVLSAADAVAAARGGAGRLEVCRDLPAGGLTPARATVAGIKDAVDLPLRVMLRPRTGFAINESELAALCEEAGALAEIGADAFVFGFLTLHRDVDEAASGRLAGAGGRPWTFHRAFDHARRPRAAFDAVRRLPGVDRVLSSGGDGGLPAGLVARAAWQGGGPRWIAGGGLRPEHVAVLAAAGIGEFHVGTGARQAASWEQPVRPELVARYREAAERAPGQASSQPPIR
jgi:copper homeostasis protein CutC